MNTIIFMGTGPFALEALRGLWEVKGDNRLLVYTKEAKKAGRGMKAKDGCVAEFAREKGLPLYQPHSLKEEEAKEEFLALQADLVVVASYGLILPPYVIDAPRCGCINIHASLLPKWRGAAPINRAILEGDEESGVTLMKMDEGLDTGDILWTVKTPIEALFTAGDLFDLLAVKGKELLLEHLDEILAEKISPTPQDHSQSTYAAKITAEDQVLDFSQSAQALCRRIRALSPMPGALCKTAKDGKLLKIYAAHTEDGAPRGEIGEVVAVKPSVLVQCGAGFLSLETVQPEGKGRMSAHDAVNGRKLSVGDILA